MNKNSIQYTVHSTQVLRFLVAISLLVFAVGNLYCETKRVQFENGFTFIHQEKEKVGLVSVNLFIKGGNINEKDEEAGVTSLMTQILIKGTVNRDSEKIAEETESIGATISAGCSNNYSEVSLIVPSENIDTAFDIFADIVNNPTFPENEFEKEKVRTIAGIKSKIDHIFSISYDQFNELIFKKHPYHRPISGYESSVSSLTISQISDIYRKNFKPENMILSINGDINFDKAKQIVEKYFKNIKIIGAEDVFLGTVTYKITQNKPVREISQSKFHQAYIFTGFLAPDISQNEYVVFKVINTVVGGGMGSRLFNALREQNGLVYEADSFYPTRKEISDFVFYAGMSKENLEIVEKAFDEEMKKFSEVSEEELKNAKVYLKGTFLMDHRTIQRQGWWNGFWEVMGKGYEYDSKYLDDIDAVTIADIKTAAEKFYNPQKTTTLILK